MKWICTVCKYVHEGNEPPDVCPVCGAPKEVFEKEAAASEEKPAADDGARDSQSAEPRKWICTVCGYVYDPAVGDPDHDVAAGTAFEDVPEGWVCPLCGAGKDAFEKTE